ncbi:PREDICTED: solute carrier family 2, facilitated glucose transporter member 1-like isoform X2 [Ceratosolen solmsi marchali]|uniref:Solute carrier family 2, facilitated glucose transporter member 1-like isoform X2 n=1 Tax=Ceratosolen solmsi marchali TaxID=326594 RepID=A0AAJ6YG70_9HYME|nr:PREDICTED: solute carrier family 2, facilitated glucose transporter member 1-like isoform X2 [Ceratosolen solmsi marchali]
MKKLKDPDVTVLYKLNEINLLNDSEEKKYYDDNSSNCGGWTPLLILAGITCCLGSAVPAGYNIGVMNNAAFIMQEFCNQSIEERFNIKISLEGLNLLWSTIVSIFLIGGVTGSLTSSLLADTVGRKSSLSIGNVCGIVGSVMFLLIPILNSIELFLLGRLFVGLSGGLATSLLPVYMTEIAPIRLRGAVGVLCQLGITCGVLLGQVAGLDSVLGTKYYWNYMLAAFAPLCTMGLILTFFLPESPKYLFVVKEDSESALEALSRFRNMDRMDLHNEIANLEQELASKSVNSSWTIIRVLKEPTLRLPILLVCLLQFGQQLSGINVVFYYSDVIFKKAELAIKTRQYATIGTGLVNVGMAISSVYLMSRFRRRALLLTSIYTTIGCLIILCASIALIDLPFMKWICIIAVLAYVLFYGIGLGPIPYFIGSELFDVGPKSKAMSIGSVCNWGGNFIVGMTFTSMQKVLNSYSFLIFAACILFLALFCRKYLPETRDKTTSEIAALITQGLKSRPNEENSDIIIT